MSFKERLSGYFSRMRTRHKLSFTNDTTYKEKWSVRVSALNLLSLIALYTFIVVVALLLLVKYTPLKTLFVTANIYENENKIDENTALIDSLYTATKANELYLKNLQRILNDEPIDTSPVLVDTLKNFVPDFSKNASDSVLRKKVESDLNDKMQFGSSEQYAFFFSPVEGIVSRSFDAEDEHYGIDVATLEDEPIKACLEGTVVFTSWTPAEGKVVIVQHKDELVSVYKHCSDLLKNVGEQVQTGDPIAIVGNTGENSSGPHLHFELWKKGVAINPAAFISF